MIPAVAAASLLVTVPEEAHTLHSPFFVAAVEVEVGAASLCAMLLFTVDYVQVAVVSKWIGNLHSGWGGASLSSTMPDEDSTGVGQTYRMRSSKFRRLCFKGAEIVANRMRMMWTGSVQVQ
jgi:hypothetical protein